jgi:TonB-linked SusC/RagA family outer membrane protein
MLVLFFSISVMSQDEFVLEGVVTSQSDNQPIPGANVVVVNTTNGTSTDFDGKFSITVSNEDVLEFSSLGYVKQLVIVNGQTSLNVSLEVDASQLDEVVVIGYGTQKKSHLTGSISKVVNEKLDQIAVSRIDDALVGQVSGVNIQATEGEAGSAPTITIRGFGSINGASGPAIVVDGVVVDSDYLGNLDMNDVQSFEILKDAASAAIYGAEGANGVIMITTKEGKEGETRFSYNTYIGFKTARQSDAYKFSMADHARNEAAWNIANGTTGLIDNLSEDTRYKLLIGVDQDWQDIIFDGGTITSHSIAARGGNSKTKYSTSLKYLHDEGVLLTDDFKSYSLKLKLDTQASKKFKVGLSITPSYSLQKRFDGSTHDILRQSPWLPLYHTDHTIQFVDRANFPDVQVGDYAVQTHFNNYALLPGDTNADVDISSTSNTNPGAKVLERDRLYHKYKLLSSVYGKYDFNDNLTLTSRFSASIQKTNQSRWQGLLAHKDAASRAFLRLENQTRTKLINDNYLTYNKEFGKNEVTATAGITLQSLNTKFDRQTGIGYTSDAIQDLSAATSISTWDSYKVERNKIGMFARVNFAHDDKYLATVSLRRDGSSVFGSKTKYGYFPAASIGWNIHKEDFLSNSDVISKLKFRASYGFTGADIFNTSGPLVDNYAYLALLNQVTATVDGTTATGFAAINIANPDLQWERSGEFNPAIEFGLFNNKISGSIDYYKRTSDKLLLDNPISSTTGFTSALVNRGEVVNSGWEFELRTKNVSNENFSWSSTFIGSLNENELTSFADSNGQIQSVDSKRASEWINLEGNPISSFYGWVVDRDIPLENLNDPFRLAGLEAQDVYVKDLNGDGLIDDEDKTILGDPYPEFVWSVTNQFKLGNIDASFMFQGSHGAEVRNMGDQYLFNQFNSGADFNTTSTPDQQFIKAKIFTDDIIQDASYVALRNVNIGYTFSDDLISKLNVSKLRIYFSGQNLMYLTADNYTGLNPESINNTSPTTYGYQRAGSPVFSTVSFGLNLDF